MPEDSFKNFFEELAQMAQEEQKEKIEKEKKAKKKKERVAKVVSWIFRIYVTFCLILGTVVLLSLLAKALYPVFSILIHAFATLFT